MSAYSRFHTQLALHGLRQFANSLKSSVEVVLLAFGQWVLMALALAAWPLWLDALWLSRGWAPWRGMALLLGYSLLMTVPVILLRQRILPKAIVLWSRTLPASPRQRWRAHAAVMRLFIGPLVPAYALSSLACWIELPAIRAVWPLGLTIMLLSLGLTWLAGSAVLWLRQHGLEQGASRLPRGFKGAAGPAPIARYHYHPRPLPLLQTWYRLFFLPFWRLENGIGMQQVLLFMATATAFVAWQMPSPPFVRFLLCIACASLSLIVTDRGDKAVQEQIARSHAHVHALPLASRPLYALAKLLCLLPVAVILAGFALRLVLVGGDFHPGVAKWYLIGEAVAQAAIVGLAHLSSAGRARIVIFFATLLAAIGSELWK